MYYYYYCFCLLLFTGRVICEDCVIVDFQNRLGPGGIINGLTCSGRSWFIIRRYSDRNMMSPHPSSTTFREPLQTASCIRTGHNFVMRGGGILEVNGWRFDAPIIMVRVFAQNNTHIVSANLPRWNSSWQPTRIIIPGSGSFNGYILFDSERVSSGATGFIDSFRYISPSINENSCVIYKQATTTIAPTTTTTRTPTTTTTTTTKAPTTTTTTRAPTTITTTTKAPTTTTTTRVPTTITTTTKASTATSSTTAAPTTTISTTEEQTAITSTTDASTIISNSTEGPTTTPTDTEAPTTTSTTTQAPITVSTTTAASITTTTPEAPLTTASGQPTTTTTTASTEASRLTQLSIVKFLKIDKFFS